MDEDSFRRHQHHASNSFISPLRLRGRTVANDSFAKSSFATPSMALPNQSFSRPFPDYDENADSDSSDEEPTNESNVGTSADDNKTFRPNSRPKSIHSEKPKSFELLYSSFFHICFIYLLFFFFSQSIFFAKDCSYRTLGKAWAKRMQKCSKGCSIKNGYAYLFLFFKNYPFLSFACIVNPQKTTFGSYSVNTISDISFFVSYICACNLLSTISQSSSDQSAALLSKWLSDIQLKVSLKSKNESKSK